MDPWRATYEAILSEFGWAEADDRAAAEALRDLIPDDRWKHVGTELKHRPAVTVVGCGPALDTVRVEDFPSGIVVAADGATARLRELGIIPRIVVTDLDGDAAALRWAAGEGASMAVHAHGGNQHRFALVGELGPFVVGTYQNAEDPDLAPLRNVGGFTDGDRAVRLCEQWDVRRVHLLCFDFDAQPSRHSGTWDPATKPGKLRWAERIIAQVATRGRTEVVQVAPRSQA